jgi:hypothetical protein
LNVCWLKQNSDLMKTDRCWIEIWQYGQKSQYALSLCMGLKRRAVCPLNGGLLSWSPFLSGDKYFTASAEIRYRIKWLPRNTRRILRDLFLTCSPSINNFIIFNQQVYKTYCLYTQLHKACHLRNHPHHYSENHKI